MFYKTTTCHFRHWSDLLMNNLTETPMLTVNRLIVVCNSIICGPYLSTFTRTDFHFCNQHYFKNNCVNWKSVNILQKVYFASRKYTQSLIIDYSTQTSLTTNATYNALSLCKQRIGWIPFWFYCNGICFGSCRFRWCP